MVKGTKQVFPLNFATGKPLFDTGASVNSKVRRYVEADDGKPRSRAAAFFNPAKVLSKMRFMFKSLSSRSKRRRLR